MVRALVGTLLLLSGCGEQHAPQIIAHRAQGVGEPGENLPGNVPLALAQGFGAEVDLRGDGDTALALGHLAPNGHDLAELLDVLQKQWQEDFAGKLLVLDVANDSDARVSATLTDSLLDRVTGTELAQLHYIVQSSTWDSLAHMHSLYVARRSEVKMGFAMTFWWSPEYTVPGWVDYVTTNVSELGDYPHPRPVLLFGVETRSSFRISQRAQSQIDGLITDHPRRVLAMQGD